MALNLLFIIFDDLRPELTAYNRFHVIDPNFQRLANRSVIFDKVFTQIAVCNPSRDSLLTGLRPDTVGTYGFQSTFRPHLIFPNQFVSSGYDTAG
jgi:iduronate 2-sulfatase